MIRVLLQGGLGNHLFQVAAGLSLARRHGTGIRVDTALMPQVTHEYFLWRLPVFRLRFPRSLACRPADRLCRRLTGRHCFELLGAPLYREPDHEFREEFARLPDGIVLQGFFQNERYLEVLGADLRRWFSLAPWLAAAPAAIRDQLAAGSAPAVGVHIRRGDYLAHAMLNVCGAAYYHRAIARVRDEIPGARLFVFSDDLEWCRQEFGERTATYVDNRGHPYSLLLDLALLSACRHQVIGNSSFSWWAAWLNARPDRIVYLPDRWSSDGTIPLGTKLMSGARIVPTLPSA